MVISYRHATVMSDRDVISYDACAGFDVQFKSMLNQGIAIELGGSAVTV